MRSTQFGWEDTLASGSERSVGTVEKLATNDFHIVTHIDIEASAEDVWATLTDWDNLDSWSSSFVSLVGDFSAGGHIKVAFKVMGTTQNYEHDLVDFVEGSQFAWSDPFMFGMVDHHMYRVEATAAETTRFHQTDQVKGGAAGLIGGLTARKMKSMYARFNQELATEVGRRLAVGG